MSVRRRGKFFHYAFMINGKRYRGSCGKSIKTLSQAERYEALLIADVEQQGAITLTKKAPFLSDYADRFLKNIQDSATMDADTKRYYSNGWRLLKGTPVANLRLDAITSSDADVLEFPGGPSNANTALRTLRKMLSMATDQKIIRSRPKIRERKERRRDAVLSLETQKLLLEKATGNIRAFLIIALDTGMRPDEIRRMTWSNILWDRNLIYNPDGKTRNATRYVPLSFRCKAMLRDRLTEMPDGTPWVFPKPATKQKPENWTQHLSEWSFSQAFRRLRRRLNLNEGLIPYLTRHTFATDYLQGSGNIRATGIVLGHGSTRPTERYVHPGMQDMADIINRRNGDYPTPIPSKHELLRTPASVTKQ